MTYFCLERKIIQLYIQFINTYGSSKQLVPEICSIEEFKVSVFVKLKENFLPPVNVCHRDAFDDTSNFVQGGCTFIRIVGTVK